MKTLPWHRVFPNCQHNFLLPALSNASLINIVLLFYVNNIVGSVHHSLFNWLNLYSV